MDPKWNKRTAWNLLQSRFNAPWIYKESSPSVFFVIVGALNYKLGGYGFYSSYVAYDYLKRWFIKQIWLALKISYSDLNQANQKKLAKQLLIKSLHKCMYANQPFKILKVSLCTSTSQVEAVQVDMVHLMRRHDPKMLELITAYEQTIEG